MEPIKDESAKTHTLTDWWHKKWVRVSVWSIGLIGMVLFLIVNLLISTRDVDALEAASPQPTLILDRQGNVASKISTSPSEAIHLEDLPDHMIQAVVAIEDRRFYQHSGMDYWGTLRAAIANLRQGTIAQGGSTITQQLTKNIFLTHDRTYKRKVKEILLAKKVERTYTKDEIMEMYLNTIYFGEGAWGVKKAAQIYFGKEPKELTVGESALLAGMIRSPSSLSPFKHFNQAMARRDVVLNRMEEEGFLDEAKMAQTKKKDIVLQGQQPDDYRGRYPSYVDAIIQEATQRYGLTEKEVLSGGLRIYTELDSTMQQAAEKVTSQRELFPKGSDDQPVQSGSVLLDPKTGGIRALVGGRGKHVFRGFNRATQLQRQPGSAMKPLSVYAPALAAGYDLDARLKDQPMSFGDYTPNNYDDQYLGEVTMYEALVDSRNVPAVWLLDQIGVDQGVRFSKAFGISLTQEDHQLGLALGGLNKGVSPLEMSQAYAAFANNGIMVDAHTIRRVETVEGDTLGKWYKKSVRVTQPKVAQHITYMLRGAVQEGTGKKAQVPGRPTAGKTGTTQLPGGEREGAKDHWFVGYTPNLVGAVWIGYDQTDSEHYLTGSSGSTAAVVFREMMSKALADRPVGAFDLDAVKWKEPPRVEREDKEEKENESLQKKLREWEKQKDELSERWKEKKQEWKERLGEWKKG